MIETCPELHPLGHIAAYAIVASHNQQRTQRLCVITTRVLLGIKDKDEHVFVPLMEQAYHSEMRRWVELLDSGRRFRPLQCKNKRKQEVE